MKKLTLAALIAGLATVAQAAPFKVGAMTGPEGELVHIAAKIAKEKHGLDVEVIEFEDYVMPNVALSDGSIDANAIQHTSTSSPKSAALTSSPSATPSSTPSALTAKKSKTSKNSKTVPKLPSRATPPMARAPSSCSTNRACSNSKTTLTSKQA